MRRSLSVIVLAAVLVLAGGLPAHAQEPSSPTTLAEQELPGIIPKPNSGRKPEQPGDRGGALQTITFAVIMGGLAVIGVVIARSTARTTRARMAASGKPPRPPR